MVKNSCLTVFVVFMFIFSLISVIVLAALTSVTLVYPADDDIILGTIELNATTDDDAENATFYYYNGTYTEIGTNDTSGKMFNLTWDTTTLKDGYYNITVNASNDTFVVTNTSYDVLIDNTPPSIWDVRPIYYTNDDSGYVRAIIEDTYGIDNTSAFGLSYIINGTEHNWTVSPWIDWSSWEDPPPYHLGELEYDNETESFSEGDLIIVNLTAWDKAGNYKEIDWNFTIDLTPPQFQEFSITNNKTIGPNNYGTMTLNVTDNYELNTPILIGILDDGLLQGGQYLKLIFDYNLSIFGNDSFNGTYQWDGTAFVMTNGTQGTGYLSIHEDNVSPWEDYFYTDGWFYNASSDEENWCMAFFNDTDLSFAGMCWQGEMDIPAGSTYKAIKYNGTFGNSDSCWWTMCENTTSLLINNVSFALKDPTANDSSTFTMESLVIDRANNYNATYIYNVLIDTTPPNIILITPEDGGWVNDDNLTFTTLTYNSTDNRGFINCSIWTNATEDGSWVRNATNATPANGTNTFSLNFTNQTYYKYNIHCYDKAFHDAWGNETNWTFGVDWEPPSKFASGLSCSASHDSITLSWTAGTDNFSGPRYLVYRIKGGETLIFNASDVKVVDTGLTPLTKYEYRLQTWDNAGNQNTTGGSGGTENLTISCTTTEAPQPPNPPNPPSPPPSGSSSGFYITDVTSPLTINAGSSKTATFKIVNNYEFAVNNVEPDIEGIEDTWFSLDKTSITQMPMTTYEIVTVTFTIPSNAQQKNYSVVYRADGTSGMSEVPRAATYSGTLTVTAPRAACNPNWSCTDWGECIDDTQTRTCLDANNCGTTSGKPAESQTCGEGTTTTPGGLILDPTLTTAAILAIILLAIAAIYFYKKREAWRKLRYKVGRGFGRGGPVYTPRKI